MRHTINDPVPAKSPALVERIIIFAVFGIGVGIVCVVFLLITMAVRSCNH